MVARLVIDDARCTAWIARGVAGDRAACHDLVAYLWPIWLEMVRSSRAIAALTNAEDAMHDVVAKLVEKVGRPEGRGLALYLAWQAQHPEKTFSDWLRIVTSNAIRDQVRERLGTQRTAAGEPGVKRLLNEFASAPVLDEIGVRPPITMAQTARELIEFARSRLTPQQMQVLEAWLKGATFEEIDRELELSEGDARQGQRAAVAVLRRHFAGTRHS